MSYHSFLVKGSTIFFPFPFLPFESRLFLPMAMGLGLARVFVFESRNVTRSGGFRISQRDSNSCWRLAPCHWFESRKRLSRLVKDGRRGPFHLVLDTRPTAQTTTQTSTTTKRTRESKLKLRETRKLTARMRPEGHHRRWSTSTTTRNTRPTSRKPLLLPTTQKTHSIDHARSSRHATQSYTKACPRSVETTRLSLTKLPRQSYSAAHPHLRILHHRNVCGGSTHSWNELSSGKSSPAAAFGCRCSKRTRQARQSTL